MHTIHDIATISKLATERIAKEYEEYGWKNPPVVTMAMVEAVLDAYQQIHPRQSMKNNCLHLNTQQISGLCHDCGEIIPFAPRRR